MDREPIEVRELDGRIRVVPFDDYVLLMALCVIAHERLAAGEDRTAETVFDAVDRLADLLAPRTRKREETAP
jgi:hypothetical protein